jgi:hypothetical protein
LERGQCLGGSALLQHCESLRDLANSHHRLHVAVLRAGRSNARVGVWTLIDDHGGVRSAFISQRKRPTLWAGPLDQINGFSFADIACCQIEFLLRHHRQAWPPEAHRNLSRLGLSSQLVEHGSPQTIVSHLENQRDLDLAIRDR